MRSGELSQGEINKAREHLTDIGAYAPFDIDKTGRQMSGCMDPREANLRGGDQAVIMMGPGGEIGDATDHAVAMTVAESGLITIEQALPIDMSLRRTSVHGAHHDCAFVASLPDIMAEQAKPTDFTAESVDRWIAEHDLGYTVTPTILDKAKDGSARIEEHLRGMGSVEHLLEVVDRFFPEDENVVHMRGTANPHFYIVNGWPIMGLNRHLKHRTQKLRAQAYHDNLAARLADTHNTHAIPPDIRTIRMASLLLRSAATRTVIDSAKRATGQQLEHWEIEIGQAGPIFKQIM